MQKNFVFFTKILIDYKGFSPNFASNIKQVLAS